MINTNHKHQTMKIESLLNELTAGTRVTINGHTETVTGKVSTTCKLNKAIIVLDDDTREFRRIDSESLRTINSINF